MKTNDAQRKFKARPRTMRARIRRPMISGLLIVIPMGITVFVLKLFYDFTAGYLTPFVRKYIDATPDYTSPLLACLLMALIIYLVGLIAGAAVGRKIILFFENLIQKIPYIKFIYGACKQIVQAVLAKGIQKEPKIPVVVEFPRPGMKCLGFALGKARFRDGREYYRVFVPTTPNITVGLLQFIAPENVYQCYLTMDDAVKLIVSAGILGPESMSLQNASQSPLLSAPDLLDDDDDEWEEVDE